MLEGASQEIQGALRLSWEISGVYGRGGKRRLIHFLFTRSRRWDPLRQSPLRVGHDRYYLRPAGSWLHCGRSVGVYDADWFGKRNRGEAPVAEEETPPSWKACVKSSAACK